MFLLCPGANASFINGAGTVVNPAATTVGYRSKCFDGGSTGCYQERPCVEVGQQTGVINPEAGKIRVDRRLIIGHLHFIRLGMIDVKRIIDRREKRPRGFGPRADQTPGIVGTNAVENFNGVLGRFTAAADGCSVSRTGRATSVDGAVAGSGNDHLLCGSGRSVCIFIA